MNTAGLIIASIVLVAFVALLILKAVRMAGSTASVQQFEKYRHHDRDNWVRSDLKGRHRDHCLCYDCERFHPGTDGNCSIAQVVYTNCVAHNLVTPVWECPKFKQDAYAHCRPWNQ